MTALKQCQPNEKCAFAATSTAELGLSLFWTVQVKSEENKYFIQANVSCGEFGMKYCLPYTIIKYTVTTGPLLVPLLMISTEKLRDSFTKQGFGS